MPTGYTAGVKDGKVTEFKDYALSCARAFGALILMRDDPMDAPIPERFEPTDYHLRGIKRAQERLIELEKMTPEEASRQARAAYDEARTARQQRREERAADRHRYEAMLEKVRRWTPPSPDHVEYKKFMVKQLEESIDFDCNDSYDDGPAFKVSDEWRAEQIKMARDDVDYHKAEHAKEGERVEGRNRWVRQLRESLT